MRRSAHASLQVLFYAVTTSHIAFHGCVPGELGGYSKASQAWEKKHCVTEEMVWCDAHPGEHPDCATASCRAEEIRMSLGDVEDYGGEPVYPCPDLSRLQRWADRMRSLSPEMACVPDGDKRSFHLPQCSAADAATRSEFYIERRLVSARSQSKTWTI